MKFLSAFVLLVAVSCSAAALITPVKSDTSLVPLQKQLDLLANSRRVIEELVQNIRKYSQDALDAFTRFSATVQQQALASSEKFAENVRGIRARVTQTLENLRKRFTESGAVVRDCFASRENEVSQIFSDAVNKSMSCANDRVSEVGPQITDLRSLGQEGMDYANATLQAMIECTQTSEGLLAAASCLASIAMQAEMKTLSFASRAALTMGRIGLSVATLPASLEVCAGSRLVEAGLGTSRIMMEVGTCSAASVYTMMTSNAEFQTTAF